MSWNDPASGRLVGRLWQHTHHIHKIRIRWNENFMWNFATLCHIPNMRFFASPLCLIKSKVVVKCCNRSSLKSDWDSHGLVQLTEMSEPNIWRWIYNGLLNCRFCEIYSNCCWPHDHGSYDMRLTIDVMVHEIYVWYDIMEKESC